MFVFFAAIFGSAACVVGVQQIFHKEENQAAVEISEHGHVNQDRSVALTHDAGVEIISRDQVDCTSVKSRTRCLTRYCGWTPHGDVRKMTRDDKLHKGSCKPCEAHLQSTCPRIGCKNARTALGVPKSCVPRVKISFGGAKSGTGKFGKRNRPEDAHSELCLGSDTTACSECSNKAWCWFGGDGLGTGSSKMSTVQKVSVPHDSPRGDRALTVWTQCESDSTTSKITYNLLELVNGEIDVFVDGSGTPWSSMSDCRYPNCPGKMTLPPKTGDRHVRIVLRIADNSKDASAQVQLISATNPYVDKCMTGKMCLKKLIVGAAGFTIRNNNTKQLQCLLGQDKSKTCSRWKGCLLKQQDHVDELIQILRAGLLPVSSQGEIFQILATRSQGLKLKRTQDHCIDPASSDPEAFDCECLEELQEKCKEASETEGCLREMMCKHPQVCESWKGTQCDTTLIAGAMAVHEQVMINSNASTKVEFAEKWRLQHDAQQLLSSPPEEADKPSSMLRESQATNLVERSERSTSAHGLDGSLKGKCSM